MLKKSSDYNPIHILKESLIAGVIAFLIFGPLTGIILDGFVFEFHPLRPLTLAFIVAIGRFTIFYIINTEWGKKKWQNFYSKRNTLVTVEKTHPHKLQFSLLAIAIISSIILPFIIEKYWLTIAILALIYVLLGCGLNIVVGLAGLLDLGFVAFYAVGAYGFALGSSYLGLSFWAALPFCALLAATFGAILGFPVLRMHGDYLAIVTLGFGEIIRLILTNWVDFTGGPNGISAPTPTIFGLEFTRYAKNGGTPFHEFFGIPYSSEARYIFIYLILLATVLCVLYAANRLKNMPIGRAWEAIREDEIACRALGINHVTTKLAAFSLGATIGGLGGVFFAAYQGFVNPSSFTFIESALILAIVILGGTGSLLGVVIAAVVLTVIPELLREAANFRMLAFGGLMVFMMIIRPRGLIRVKRRRYNVDNL